MTLSRNLFATASAVALLLPVSAFAQLASPVAGGGQSGSASPSGVPQIAVPPAEIVPYRPQTIEATPSVETAIPEPEAKAPRIPPRPASEYERFVSEVAGKPLRRFGTELLLPEAKGFAVPPVAAVPADYRLNPGDELLIGLTGSVQASGLRLTIDPEGRIFIPRVGAIRVGGMRYGDVHGVIERQVARQYRGFTLEVAVGKLRGVTVYVKIGRAHV